MEFKTPNYFEPPPLQSLFAIGSQGGEEALEEEEEEEGSSIYKKDGSFKCYVVDTLTELNLKETSEFVKAFAVVNKNVNAGQQRRSSSSSTSIGVTSVTPPTDAQPPPTPCRPIFNFTSTSNTSAIGIANTNTNNHHRISSSSFSTTRNNYMMTIPSKWDDAQKWLINHSPSAHNKQPLAPPPPQQQEHVLSSDKPKGMFHRSISLKANRHHHHTNTNTNSSFTSMASHGGGEDPTKPHSLLLQDKFTDEVEQNYKCLEPTKEGFLFGNSKDKFVQKAAAAATGATFHEEVKHRDIGTEMTPLGSSTTSRCNTPPFKTSSPARHNTPSNTSGPLQHSTNHNIDISQFQDCHLAKLQLPTQYDSVTSNWSSREEEEEEISKSLRHFEMSNDFVCAKNVSESAVSYDWKAEEKTKCCLRYQREEAKIQAWVNLQNAKADAQSRKLEVKIEKMRSNLEEKLMKRTAIVNRKAEELRAAAELQHSEQMRRLSVEEAKKTTSTNGQNSYFSGHNKSCGCFPRSK